MLCLCEQIKNMNITIYIHNELSSENTTAYVCSCVLSASTQSMQVKYEA